MRLSTLMFSINQSPVKVHPYLSRIRGQKKKQPWNDDLRRAKTFELQYIERSINYNLLTSSYYDNDRPKNKNLVISFDKTPWIARSRLNCKILIPTWLSVILSVLPFFAATRQNNEFLSNMWKVIFGIGVPQLLSGALFIISLGVF